MYDAHDEDPALALCVFTPPVAAILWAALEPYSGRRAMYVCSEVDCACHASTTSMLSRSYSRHWVICFLLCAPSSYFCVEPDVKKEDAAAAIAIEYLAD